MWYFWIETNQMIYNFCEWEMAPSLKGHFNVACQFQTATHCILILGFIWFVNKDCIKERWPRWENNGITESGDCRNLISISGLAAFGSPRHVELFNRLSPSYIGSEPLLCPAEPAIWDVISTVLLVSRAVRGPKLGCWLVEYRREGVTCLHIVITFFLMNW